MRTLNLRALEIARVQSHRIPRPLVTSLGAALFAGVVVLPAGGLFAQDSLARYSDAFESQLARSQPAVTYTVRLDATDLGGYTVEMRVRGAPDTLRLALPIWAPGAYRVVNFARYLKDLTVLVDGKAAGVTRPDSSTWLAIARGGDATIRYRIAYPSIAAASTPNNRAFMRETGGLIDGPATYLYLAGRTLVPAHVRFELPAEWRIATGLVPTADPRVFFAPSYDVLIDSPVLLGALRTWTFAAAGIPHRIAYWPRPDATPFDTAAFVSSIERITRSAIDIFGVAPYREYTFIFVDGAGGGLEHLNSATMGAPSAALARDPASRASLIAHEFFHLWNVKRLRPSALGPFDYANPVRTTGLWFSEGVTDYYADALMRRTGHSDEPAARETLAGNIAAYLGNPAHARISPERSSWTTWDTPAANGGYSISYYLQGALLGELLDMILRDSTRMRLGMDDVMRLMFDRFGGARGFAGEDILRTVNRVCDCDLQLFFQKHVSGAEQIDFNYYLSSMGLRATVTRALATDSAGRPLPDRRVSVTAFGGIGSAGGVSGSRARLSIPDPTSAWGRAGLRSGDELINVDGKPIPDGAALRDALANRKIGDRMRVEYSRAGQSAQATVTLASYAVVRVTLDDLPTISAVQRERRKLWMTGKL